MAYIKQAELEEVLRECGEFEYSYSPKNTEADRRWVFQRATKLTRTEAYEYAVSLIEAAEAL